MEAEIYKITSVNEIGDDVSIYVLPAGRRMNKRMMLDQYGNVEEEGMDIADLPEDIKKQLSDAGILFE